MRRMKVGALAVAVGALAITAAACATPDRAKPSSASTGPPSASHGSNPPAADTIVLGGGRSRTASRTVSDWVTYADHVLVVTVVNETRLAASNEEIERGEGLIGRTVVLRVDRVLWSAPDAPQPAPITLKLSAAGWLFNDNSGFGEWKIAVGESSRLDKGHTYIRALEWTDDPCFEDPKQGWWDGLGSGDTIPFDGGVLGAGEFEGRMQTLDQSRAKWRADAVEARSVRGQIAGGTVATLVANLMATSPRPETAHAPAESNLSDR